MILSHQVRGALKWVLYLVSIVLHFILHFSSNLDFQIHLLDKPLRAKLASRRFYNVCIVYVAMYYVLDSLPVATMVPVKLISILRDLKAQRPSYQLF